MCRPAASPAVNLGRSADIDDGTCGHHDLRLRSGFGVPGRFLPPGVDQAVAKPRGKSPALPGCCRGELVEKMFHTGAECPPGALGDVEGRHLGAVVEVGSESPSATLSSVALVAARIRTSTEIVSEARRRMKLFSSSTRRELGPESSGAISPELVQKQGPLSASLDTVGSRSSSRGAVKDPLSCPPLASRGCSARKSPRSSDRRNGVAPGRSSGEGVASSSLPVSFDRDQDAASGSGHELELELKFLHRLGLPQDVAERYFSSRRPLSPHLTESGALSESRPPPAFAARRYVDRFLNEIAAPPFMASTADSTAHARDDHHPHRSVDPLALSGPQRPSPAIIKSVNSET